MRRRAPTLRPGRSGLTAPVARGLLLIRHLAHHVDLDHGPQGTTVRMTCAQGLLPGDQGVRDRIRRAGSFLRHR